MEINQKENMYLKRRCIELEHENQIFRMYADAVPTIKSLRALIKDHKHCIHSYREYIRREQQEIKKLQNVIDGRQRQNASVHGVAFKDNVSKETIAEMQAQGMNVSQIAEKLEVTRQTIYNRIKGE